MLFTKLQILSSSSSSSNLLIPLLIMPRGIPNAKRDETGLRFTTFHVPLGLNPKQISNNYLKSESQTLWARNAARRAKDNGPGTTEARRGSNVIVIHPGSRYLRIGKACDVNPVTVPNVIARKQEPPIPKLTYIPGITRPSTSRSKLPVAASQSSDEYAVPIASDDPFDVKLSSTTISLRERMRFYKLRVTQNAGSIASTFNKSFIPEILPDHTDPYKIEWITESDEDIIVGEKALQLANPHQMGYTVRWPIHGGRFNTRDYPSSQMIFSDIQAIFQSSLKDDLEIDPQTYKDYSVVLVIPDFHDRAYVRDMVNILLVSMGFKQICVQQESLAATYGAGISNACVVDIGAVVTSITCVDDGLIVPDTRMVLNTGGNDITEFLYVLLTRIGFPYHDADLALWHDWNLMEDLKARLCTLAEGDVALNLYDFIVRRPGKPTEKYGLRAYDEIILAPMCIFEPRIIEFDVKFSGSRSPKLDITEEIMDPTDQFTQAMVISTQHLVPAAPSEPQAAESGQAPSVLDLVTEVKSEVASSTSTSTPTPGEPSTATPKTNEVTLNARQPSPMDTDKFGSEAVPGPAPTTKSQPLQQPESSPGNLLPTIDVAFEASKLPLDVAIFNSARAAGGDDRIKKYLQAVLVVGGTALIPGMAHALESRLQAIATPLIQNMEKVQIIPPPKEVDKRVLVWKGASVLGRMEGVAELWVTAADWDILGMRGLKERCFFL